MTLDTLKNLDREDILHALGLETRRTAVDYIGPALALFGVGMLVGTGVGLLMAPRPGRELREDLAHRLQRAPDALARLPQRTSEALHHAADQLNESLHDGRART